MQSVLAVHAAYGGVAPALMQCSGDATADVVAVQF
jgi:hypothetical protein